MGTVLSPASPGPLGRSRATADDSRCEGGASVWFWWITPAAITTVPAPPVRLGFDGGSGLGWGLAAATCFRQFQLSRQLIGPMGGEIRHR